MKKLKIVICILTILSMLLISGCKSTDAPIEKNDTGEFDKSPVNSSLIHGFPDGTWFMIGTGISESVNRSYPGSIIQVTPGTSTENLYRLEDYAAEFGLTHSSGAFAAINGIGVFDKKFVNISGIAALYPSPAQLVVRKELGVTSFSEFIENKIPMNISIEKANSFDNIAFLLILEEYGLTVADLENWGCKIYLKDMNDSEDLFNDGLIDGMFVLAGAPTNVFVKMATNDEMIMLKLDDKIISAVTEKYGYDTATIPADTYSFLTEDTFSFVTYASLAASLQTPEETAYKMAKSIYENLEYLGTVHAALKGITFETITKSTGMPLHPGAERYYREIGLID